MNLDEFRTKMVNMLKEKHFDSQVLKNGDVDVLLQNGMKVRLNTAGLYQYSDNQELIPLVILKVEEATHTVDSNAVDNTMDMLANQNLDDFKNSLIIRAVNGKSNKDLLQDAICKQIDDEIVLVVYQLLDGNKNNFLTQVVTHKYVAVRNITIDEEELFSIALQNTEEKFPAIVVNDSGESAHTPVLLSDFHEVSTQLLMSCDNSNPNGAVTLFYPDTPRKIAAIVGPFAAVFLNTMDIMIMRPNDWKLPFYCTLASKNNEYGEFLSSHVYYFDANGILVQN